MSLERRLSPQQQRARLDARIASLEKTVARMTDQLRQAETRAGLAEASCRDAWKTARVLWHGRPRTPNAPPAEVTDGVKA